MARLVSQNKKVLTTVLAFILAVAGPLKAEVPPLLSTAWHQRAPYNDLCPDGTLAGCVAIAMSQVMYYHQYPVCGIGKNTYSWHGKKQSADFGNTFYRWGDMETDGAAVAELVYHCGVAVWMDYSTSFSGSSEYYAKSALVDFFGYSEDIKMVPRNKYTDEEWADLLRDQLDHGHPMIYSSGGHTFVVDGYNDNGLFHANMGYGSSGSNRYYTLDGLGSISNSTALINIYPDMSNVLAHSGT